MIKSFLHPKNTYITRTFKLTRPHKITCQSQELNSTISSCLAAEKTYGKSLFLIKPDSYVDGTRTNSFIWLQNATQKSQKVFVHVPSVIAAHEVEEIGVEHLLRDVKDTTISTLATEVTGKLAALKGLDARLKEIRSYLDLVIDGKIPLNHEILYHLQDVFNLLPNLNVTELIKAFSVKTNDMMLVIYLSSLIRSVVALHNLINNKILNKEHEKAEDSKPVAVPATAGS
nr:26s proteasome non-atpase regulatory subunit 7 like a [Quercus suber]